MSKKDRAIFVVCSGKYYHALGALVINLKRKGIIYDTLVVCHEDISEADRNLVTQVEPRVEFVPFAREALLEEFGLPVDPDGSYAVLLAKLKIFHLLKLYRSVLLLDLDVYINDSFEQLYSASGDIFWRSTETMATKARRCCRDTWLEKHLPPGLHEDALSPNTGLILVNDTFDGDKVYQGIVAFIRYAVTEFGETALEAAIAYSCYANKVNINQINGRKYNTFLNSYDKSKTKILHFYHSDKPWENVEVQALAPEWIANLLEFGILTGQDYSKYYYLNHLGKLYAKNKYIQYWSEIIEKFPFDKFQSLRLRGILDKNYLKFEINRKIYYEYVVCSLLDDTLRCGLWIRDKSFLADERLIKLCEYLKEHDTFEYSLEDKGIYLTSESFCLENAVESFRHFFNITYYVAQYALDRKKYS